MHVSVEKEVFAGTIVGVEVGIPSQLIFYFSDATEKGAGIAVNGVAIGGAIAAVYWLLMMVGRILSPSKLANYSSLKITNAWPMKK